MSRRRRSSRDGLLDRLAAQPWWVSATLALMVAGGLHWHLAYAQPLSYEEMRSLQGMGLSLWYKVAPVLAWVVPAILALVSLASAWRTWHLQGHVTRLGSGSDATQRMSWQTFERVVAQVYRKQGYTVEETGGGGADGGIDVRLRRGSDLILVQCKHWGRPVSVKVVRELMGVMVAHKAHHGIIVTSGRFTRSAREWARYQPIDLIDGSRLAQLARSL